MLAIANVILWVTALWSSPLDLTCQRTLITDPSQGKLLVLPRHQSTEIRELSNYIFERLPNGTVGAEISTGFVWLRDWLPHATDNDLANPLIAFSPKAVGAMRAKALFKERIVANPEAYSQILFLRETLDGGNIMTIGDHALLAFSGELTNLDLIARDILTPLLWQDISLNPVFLQSLPRETTKHVDMFIGKLDEQTLVVSDSRDEQRKAVLDRNAQWLKQLGFKVIRLMNAGPDRMAIPMSYAQLVRVGDQIFVPTYGHFVEEILSTETSTLFKELLPLNLSAKERRQFTKFAHQDDENAVRRLQQNGYSVVPVPIPGGVLRHGGSLHCLTKVYPGTVVNLPHMKIVTGCK